ncbi:conserved hypothetical protein [Thiobacillus denitrificans ATCC 25259]|uniref:HDOD domain-containing protein n=1 Tax=Thiobacillus denitrificans (strain ATCC 25259 / T1) TaxID=292415 RepID=Q3SHK4_THIDA|nr:HDOD domain-containing protein [Thiobacillus denitrificans]AAZ97882.1 conserved hypothetical protein [Thiobacillus denitrificans ATCC 25259]
MSLETKSLAGWLAFLQGADIPVLGRTAAELERLRVSDTLLTARNVANVVTDDPLMTIKLLRFLQTHKHRAQQHELIDVKQALLMLGLEAFLRDLPAAPVAEELVGSYDGVPFRVLHTAGRARRAAAYAFDWALRLHDLHPEEVQTSALLAHASEMLMWCFDPQGMLDVRQLQRGDPTLRSSEAQRRVLGFPLVALQHELALQWHLPQLLVTLMDPAQARNTRVRNVMLAVNLARHSADGWHDAALPDDFLQIGELLHMDVHRVVALVTAENTA